MANEELDEKEIKENEEEEPEAKASKPVGKVPVNKITLDLSMDPIERLKIEVENAKSDDVKKIGDYLLEEFSKDANLAACYKDRKVTLDSTFGFIRECAKKKAVTNSGGSSCMIDDDEVYGWAIHYVQDGKIQAVPSQTYTLTIETKQSLEEKAKAEFLAEQKRKLEAEAAEKELKEKKAAERQEKKMSEMIAHEKTKKEESGQLSLFDF